MEELKIINVTPENTEEHSLFCVKNIQAPGFIQKNQWFKKRYEEGLRLKILKDGQSKSIAFIEYVPAEYAWRPVHAPGYMFIHCMFTYSNSDKGKGYGAMLIKVCEEDARRQKMHGVAVMTSDGRWMANKQVFEKNGYSECDRIGRFELMVKKFKNDSPSPVLIDWTKVQKKFKGWHLLYADQCPWHEKSASALITTAGEFGINLKVKKITTALQARQGPSGFGVFSLINDGKLLEDHYISATRFKNILKKESGQAD